VARSTLLGRLLDPGSNVRARGMITLSGPSGETELGLQTRFRSLKYGGLGFEGPRSQVKEWKFVWTFSLKPSNL
jgi:hypothetical protein